MFKHTFHLFNKTEKQIIICLFFIILSVLVFFPVLSARPFWDDWVFIFRNAHFYQQSFISYFPGGQHSRSWPVFYSFMKFFHSVFGENYLFYHLASLLLHGTNGFLVWKILSRLKVKRAFWLALIYLVHPLQLLTVGWIIQFKTILSVFFFLVSVLFLIRFYLKEKYRYLFWSLCLFGLSLFSKSSTVGLIVVVILFFPPFKKKFGSKKIILTTFPFLLIASYAIIRTTWSYNFKEIFPEIVSRIDPSVVSHVQKTSLNYENNPAEKIILSCKIFTRYLGFLLYPSSNPLFQKKVETSYNSKEFFIILTTVLFVFYIGKNVIKSGDKFLQASYVFFLISLIPLCGIFWIPIFQYSNFVPYWLSVPVLGVLPLLPHYISNRKIFLALAIAFAIASHVQSYDFKSTDKIFLKSIAHSPEEKIYYVALIEQYLYSLDCQNAEKTLEQLKKLSGNEEAALTTKTTRCFQELNNYKRSK